MVICARVSHPKFAREPSQAARRDPTPNRRAALLTAYPWISPTGSSSVPRPGSRPWSSRCFTCCSSCVDGWPSLSAHHLPLLNLFATWRVIPSRTIFLSGFLQCSDLFFVPAMLRRGRNKCLRTRPIGHPTKYSPQWFGSLDNLSPGCRYGHCH